MSWGHRIVRPLYGNVLWTADLSQLAAGASSAAALAAATAGAPFILTRASSATIQKTATTIDASATTDIPCIGSYAGTSTNGLGVREARTNYLLKSRSLAVLAGNDGWATGGTNAANTTDTSADGATSGSYCTCSSAGNGPYSPHGTYTGPLTLSAWIKRKAGAGTGPYSAILCTSGSNAVYASGTLTENWTRIALTQTFSATAAYSGPMDGGGFTSPDSNTHQALAYIIDLVQVEQALFPTDVTITTGSTATRAGERLRTDTASALVDNGRLSLEFTFVPYGASSEYGANMRVWTIDANNYAEINSSTRVLTVVIAGASFAFPTAIPAWARGDSLQFFVAGGGGAFQTNGKVAKNGAAATSLGSSSSPQGTLAPTTLDILCNGTANQFTGLLNNFTAWRSGTGPTAW